MEKNVLSRRDFLRIYGGSAALMLSGGYMDAEEINLIPAEEAVDHLLLAINDLDRGIQWCEKEFGIKAVVGGSHPGGGTRNALLSLGGKRYLEIIAPDPAQQNFTFPIDIKAIKEPQLIMWAAAATNIQEIVDRTRKAGLEVMGPFDGSRTRPDGKILKWKTMFARHAFRVNNVDPIPFFIEWAKESTHPSQDSTEGVILESFEMEHPDAENVRQTLKAFGVNAKVQQSQNVRLIATLKTPKGTLKLS